MSEQASGGQRNGYRIGKLDSAEGRIEFGIPQVRGMAGWQSEVRRHLGGKSEELERLAIEMYARGLSMRDIEAAFTGVDGRSVLTRTAASRVAERLWEDYQTFAMRSLSELEIVYLFVDGVAEKLHLGQRREAVLAAWGIDFAGNKHLLSLLPGAKEDTASCRDFLRDLKARGMRDPILVASDGAPGMIRAIGEIFPKSLRQRCLAHKLRNLQSKVPEERQREVIPMARAAYQAPSSALARLAGEEFLLRRRVFQTATGAGKPSGMRSAPSHLNFKAYEDKALSADARALAREQQLYAELLTRLGQHVPYLQSLAAALAQLDTLYAPAGCAAELGWTAPVFVAENKIEIRDCRHPLVERQVDSFIPNDCLLERERRLRILTGANIVGRFCLLTKSAAEHRPSTASRLPIRLPVICWSVTAATPCLRPIISS